MKRDMELIRELLLEIESKHDGSGRSVTVNVNSHTNDVLVEHLFMLSEAGLIEGVDASNFNARGFLVMRMTWDGHEFLDAVRDPDIWRKTKERAKPLLGLGFGFMWEVAKAEVRLKLGLP